MSNRIHSNYLIPIKQPITIKSDKQSGVSTFQAFKSRIVSCLQRIFQALVAFFHKLSCRKESPSKLLIATPMPIPSKNPSIPTPQEITSTNNTTTKKAKVTTQSKKPCRKPYTISLVPPKKPTCKDRATILPVKPVKTSTELRKKIPDGPKATFSSLGNNDISNILSFLPPEEIVTFRCDKRTREISESSGTWTKVMAAQKFNPAKRPFTKNEALLGLSKLAAHAALHLRCNHYDRTTHPVHPFKNVNTVRQVLGPRIFPGVADRLSSKTNLKNALKLQAPLEVIETLLTVEKPTKDLLEEARYSEAVYQAIYKATGASIAREDAKSEVSGDNEVLAVPLEHDPKNALRLLEDGVIPDNKALQYAFELWDKKKIAADLLQKVIVAFIKEKNNVVTLEDFTAAFKNKISLELLKLLLPRSTVHVSEILDEALSNSAPAGIVTYLLEKVPTTTTQQLNSAARYLASSPCIFKIWEKGARPDNRTVDWALSDKNILLEFLDLLLKNNAPIVSQLPGSSLVANCRPEVIAKILPHIRTRPIDYLHAVRNQQPDEILTMIEERLEQPLSYQTLKEALRSENIHQRMREKLPEGYYSYYGGHNTCRGFNDALCHSQNPKWIAKVKQLGFRPDAMSYDLAIGLNASDEIFDELEKAGCKPSKESWQLAARSEFPPISTARLLKRLPINNDSNLWYCETIYQTVERVRYMLDCCKEMPKGLLNTALVFSAPLPSLHFLLDRGAVPSFDDIEKLFFLHAVQAHTKEFQDLFSKLTSRIPTEDTQEFRQKAKKAYSNALIKYVQYAKNPSPQVVDQLFQRGAIPDRNAYTQALKKNPETAIKILKVALNMRNFTDPEPSRLEHYQNEALKLDFWLPIFEAAPSKDLPEDKKSAEPSTLSLPQGKNLSS